VAKFNVGVGDAFPVDTEAARPRDIEDRVERDDVDEGYDGGRWRRRRRHRFWFVRVALICLVVYGALALFGIHAPKGLLLAAALVFGVGLVSSLFRDDERPRYRRERRRSWRDR
jgi:hypothetical protein